jgi:hypothetical protein
MAKNTKVPHTLQRLTSPRTAVTLIRDGSDSQIASGVSHGA